MVYDFSEPVNLPDGLAELVDSAYKALCAAHSSLEKARINPKTAHSKTYQELSEAYQAMNEAYETLRHYAEFQRRPQVSGNQIQPVSAMSELSGMGDRYFDPETLQRNMEFFHRRDHPGLSSEGTVTDARTGKEYRFSSFEDTGFRREGDMIRVTYSERRYPDRYGDDTRDVRTVLIPAVDARIHIL